VGVEGKRCAYTSAAHQLKAGAVDKAEIARADSQQHGYRAYMRSLVDPCDSK